VSCASSLSIKGKINSKEKKYKIKKIDKRKRKILVSKAFYNTFFRMEARIWWLRYGKNWAMSNMRVLIEWFLTQSE